MTAFLSGCTFFSWGNKSVSPSTPVPTPARPYNEKRLLSLYFHSWHRSNSGMVMTDGMIKNFYLAKPAEKPQDFNEYPVDRNKFVVYQRSHSGKYEVESVKKNERVESSGCCAIQVFDYDVILKDLENSANNVILLENARSGWSVKGWSPNDKFILFEGEESLFLFDPKTKEKKIIFRKHSNSKFIFNSDSNGIFLTSYDGKENLFEFYNIVDDQLKTIKPIGNDSQMLLSPDGKTLGLILTTSDGKNVSNQLHLFNTETIEQTNIFDLPGGVIRLGQEQPWKKDGGEIAFSVSGKDFAIDVYSINTNDGKLTHWYPPEGETTALYLPE